MNKVWAQAYKLFKSKTFRYWFLDKEIEELNEHNAAFQMVSQEEELIAHYYSNENSPGQYGNLKFMPNTLLLAQLELKSGLKRLSQKKMGEALLKLGYKRLKRTHARQVQWGYLVYEKTSDELEAQQKETETLTTEIPY